MEENMLKRGIKNGQIDVTEAKRKLVVLKSS